MSGERLRPGPIRWVWYALGGRLPDTYRTWVLHDATTRSWGWRHVARSTLLVLPLSSVWLLLPGPLWLRLALVVLAAVVGYLYALSYMEEAAEHRLAKHGYPHGIGHEVRAEARADTERESRERYLAFYRNTDAPAG